MSYLALYRKYRPSSFSDFVGQREVTDIIKNEILHNKVSHAYLFSGPRGTGKTSAAKIIAKMINCSNLDNDGIPCGKCLSCKNFNSSSDVVEIDAASNNGVDEIRELRDKVNLVPSYGKYKIYIIDEVHMLTTQAFNALLKTLEEPPPHVVFILATTEFYKIPATVVSRCQKFQFLKFSDLDIVNRLSEIAKNESILVDNDILFEIARLSSGGMRDAINMLDQLSSFSDGNLDINNVYKLSGTVSYQDFFELMQFFYNHDTLSIVKFVDNLDQNGKSLDRFLGDFVGFLKNLLIFIDTHENFSNVDNLFDIFDKLSKMINFDNLFDMISSLNDLSISLRDSSFPKVLLTTELIKFSKLYFYEDKFKDIACDKQIDNVEKAFSDNDSKSIVNNFVSKISDKEKMLRINNAFATASKNYKEDFMSLWYDIREKLLSSSNYVSITGMINDIEAMVVGSNNVIFVAQYDSLIDRLFEQVDVIEAMLFEFYHKKYKVVFLLKDEWDYEKNKYVNALKSGKKYLYIDDSNDNTINDSDNFVDDDVKKIVSVLGNDIISYE